jgi:uncharacterized protein (TIGR02145 family)
MKWCLLLYLIAADISFMSGQEQLEVYGAIAVGQSSDSASAQTGTIRWTGYTFQGWTGSTWENLNSGTVVDYDGVRYKTIKLGHQEWMTENLRTSHYANGNFITNNTSDANWMFAGPAWCWYDNLSSYGTPYGRLYNWYAVTDSRGLCPFGWHVPEDAEWTALTDFLGGLSIAGSKMKDVGLDYWLTPNLGATNTSGFTGQPGGFRDSDGTFAGISADGHWWSKSESNETNAWSVILDFDDKAARKLNAPKGSGYSVRCVKD